MAKRTKPLTCPVCKKKFYKGKTAAIGRLSKHLSKAHPKYKRKKKSTKKKLIDELQLSDDLLYRQIEDLKNKYSPRGQYQPEHNIALGALIEGVMLGIEIAKGVEKGVKYVKKVRKK